MCTNSARDPAFRLRRLNQAGNVSRFLGSLSAVEPRKLHLRFRAGAPRRSVAARAREGGGAWTVWLMLGGRGAGKTRAGAEWVRARSKRGRAGAHRAGRRDAATARNVMIEGGGPARVIAPGPAALRASKRRLTWPNGAMAKTLGGRPAAARPATRHRLVRRARKMAASRRELGHAAVRAAARRGRGRW